jgi:hypothetical protein
MDFSLSRGITGKLCHGKPAVVLLSQYHGIFTHLFQTPLLRLVRIFCSGSAGLSFRNTPSIPKSQTLDPKQNLTPNPSKRCF